MADAAKSYTQEELDAAIEERLAAVKAEGDKAFGKLWDEAKQAKADAKRTKELETRLASMEKQIQQAEKAGVTSQELDRLRGEVRADLDREYAPVKQTAESLALENRTLKLDNVVKDLMAKSGVRAGRVEALYKLSHDEYDLTDDGKPMLKNRMGTPVEKFVTEELSKAYPEFFEGTGSSGGGASKSAGGAVNGQPRVMPFTTRLTQADVEALAAGKAVMERPS